MAKRPDQSVVRHTSGTGRPKAAEAKDYVLQYFQQNKTIAQAMALVGRSPKTYEFWMANDQSFNASVAHLRAMKARKLAEARARREQRMSFERFREDYLGTKSFPHQLRWIDLIEGREPRDLHPSMIYEPHDSQLIIVNSPPEHAKSMTLSIDYVTYCICMDPDERIVIVSATQDLAKQFLWAVKQRLTHPRYAKLQLDFAPEDGFDGPASVWQATTVYLDGGVRDGVEKDPNIQALGFGGQIYGSRATRILCDDVVTLRNAHQWESQRKWLVQEVMTRVGPGGQIIVAGTRVDAVDLYRVLRDPAQYADGESSWTYLSQPAVLSYGETPEDWVTLWPRSDRPWVGSKRAADLVPDADGDYPRWDGYHLAKRRKNVGDERIWALVYQQQDVGDTAIFPAADVRAAVNGRRNHGLIDGGNVYHQRPEGMVGLYVICSMDPAMAGDTASIAYAVDPKSGRRYVLDAHLMTAPTPAQIRTLIREWTDKYRPLSWVVEKNAFQLFLTKDEEVRQYLALRGCSMVEHYTGQNKVDPDFGVASLAPLFTERQISLPSSHNCEGVRNLVEQLVVWRPGVKASLLKQDLPMALWFAEIKAREVVETSLGKSLGLLSSKYPPRYRREQRLSVRMETIGGAEEAWS